MEVAEMGLYMFVTCFFATLFQHPASPIRHIIPSGILRRAFMGAAVGATVTAIVITPWGKQSAGHFNPAITFIGWARCNFGLHFSPAPPHPSSPPPASQ